MSLSSLVLVVAMILVLACLTTIILAMRYTSTTNLQRRSTYIDPERDESHEHDHEG